MDKGSVSVLLVYVRWIVLALSMCSTTLPVVLSGATDAPEKVALARNVQRECSFTRYPNLCVDTLLARQDLGLGNEHAHLVSLLVEKTIHETATLLLRVPNPTRQLDGAVEISQTQESLGECGELMEMSLRRLNQSLAALKNSPRESKEDIQTWLSAALTFQEACNDSVNDDSPVSTSMDHLSLLASNSLALANRLPNAHGGARKLLSSGGGFPAWVSAGDRKLLRESTAVAGIRADAVVAQDGSGDYKTVAEALDGISTAAAGGGGGGRSVIYMKAGVYKEKFTVSNDNVMLVGEGKDSTIITNDASVKGGSTMPGSATVVVSGDNFIAKDIGFQNSAGAEGRQALALRMASDHGVLYRCSIQAYQDTLYALALRQFYRDCDIHGTIDFVFGNAAAVFQKCTFVLRRPHSGGFNAVFANGRSDPGQNTGFSAQGCTIGAGSDLSAVKHSVKSYLGRPWKEYSRAVVMQSTIDDAIHPSGWAAWSGGFALNTLYFAEYSNGGAGAGTSGRVHWPGFHVLDSTEASKFTVSNFIGGTSWLSSTGVIYDPGL